MKRLDLNLQDSGSAQIRLNAYLAHCGIASRRACEQIILDGRVSVNGQTVTNLGTKIASADEVLVDGKKVLVEEKLQYVILNKPAGYVCSLKDEKNRPVAADLLKETYNERLYNVGRLDMYSKGLIIFTNDGDFAAKLSHPSSEIEKEYIVETSQNVPDDLPQKFEHGIRIENMFYKCKSVVKTNSRKIHIVLTEGKNREIRKLLESQNIGVKSLTRVRIGNINLGKLLPGEFRNLTDSEVKQILKLCNNKKVY